MYPSRNRLVGFSMLALAPLVVAGSYLFSLTADESPAGRIGAVAAAGTRYVAGGLLLTVGTFLVIPAALGLIRLARGRGRVAVLTGAVMAGVGAAALGAGDFLTTVVLGVLAPSHPDLATQVERIADGSGLANLAFAFAPLLVLGLVITGIGLLADGLTPRWLPIALAVSAVVLHFAPDAPVGSLLHAPLVLSIAGLGVVLLRRPAPATAPVPAAAVTTPA